MRVPVLKPVLEGPAGGETLFFVQGWPDDRSLWNDHVALLRDRYRCVRVNLPNYEGAEHRRWGFDHDEIVEGLARCIRDVSPGRPVTIVAHDWGAYWTWLLHHRHPELVARIVGLDIAPHLTPTPKEAAMIATYQLWLLAAFLVGGRTGDWMTRRMAALAGAPNRENQRADRNYPYLYTWRDLVTGRGAKMLKGYRPQIPVLFVYGAKKPGRFHSDRWLELVRSRPGSEVVALDTGHWVTRDPKLKEIVRDWLEGKRSRLH